MSLYVEQLKHTAKMAMQRKDHEKAAEALTELISLDSENPGYRQMAAEMCRLAGRNSEAAEHFWWLVQHCIATNDAEKTLQALAKLQTIRRLRPEDGRGLFDICRRKQWPIAQCLPFLHDDDVLIYAMRSNPMFAALDDDLFEEARAACVAIHATNGERVVKTDDPADCLFIVGRGALCPVVHSDDGEKMRMAAFEAGSIVGEAAFFSKHHRRSADLYAVGNTLVYSLSYIMLEKIAGKDGALLQAMSGQYRTHGPERILAKAAFFAHLSSKQRRAIAAQTEPVSLKAGETLFDFNERSDLDLYIVHSGLLSVTGRDEGREAYLHTVGPGGVAGELGVLHNTRKTRVSAVADSTLYRWPEALYREHYMQDQKMRQELLVRQDRNKKKLRG